MKETDDPDNEQNDKARDIKLLLAGVELSETEKTETPVAPQKKVLVPSPSFFDQAKRNGRVVVEGVLAGMIARRAAINQTKNEDKESGDLSQYSNIPYGSILDAARKTVEESQRYDIHDRSSCSLVRPSWVYSHEGDGLVSLMAKDEEDKHAEPDVVQLVKRVKKQEGEQGFPQFDRRRSSAANGRESFNRIIESFSSRHSIVGQTLQELDGNESNSKTSFTEDFVGRRERNFAEFERQFSKKNVKSSERVVTPETKLLPSLLPKKKSLIKNFISEEVIEEDVKEYEVKVEEVKKTKPEKIPRVTYQDLSKKSAVIILDPSIVENSHHQAESIVATANNHTITLEPKSKPRMAFSKASTGRLGQLKSSIPPIQSSKTTPDQEVMLVGQKIGNEVVKIKTDSRLHHYAEPAKTLEPIYFKEEKIQKQVQTEKHEGQSHTKRKEENRESEKGVDTGVFKNIVDVDAMIPLFAAILEEKRRNLKAGVADETKIKALVEAPHLPDPVVVVAPAAPEMIPTAMAPTLIQEQYQQVGPLDQKLEQAQPDSSASNGASILPPVVSTEIPVERPNTTNINDPLISYNYSPEHAYEKTSIEQEMMETGRPSRPGNSARIRFLTGEVNRVESRRSLHSALLQRSSSAKSSSSHLSKSSRPIRSASTRATSASGSGSNPSTCTCSDSSCSYCYSRSTSDMNRQSASDFGETASEFALNVEYEEGNTKGFSYFKEIDDDPWGNISILNMPIWDSEELKDTDEKEDLPIYSNQVKDESIYFFPSGKMSTKRAASSISIKGTNVIPVTSKPKKNLTERELEERARNEKLQTTIDHLIEKMPIILVDRLVDAEGQSKNDAIAKSLLGAIEETGESNQSLDIDFEPSLELSLASIDQLKSLEVLREPLNGNMDDQVIHAIKKYEMEKLNKERRKTAMLKKKPTLKNSKSMVVTLPKKPDSAGKEAGEDGYVTEEDQPTKVVRNRGKELWKVIKKHLQKKFLVRSFAIKAEEGEKDPVLQAKTAEVFASPKTLPVSEIIEEAKTQVLDIKTTPIYQYHLARRILDMERFPALYKGKKVDPETKELDIQCTLRPIIGIAEPERPKLPGADLDVEKAHLLSIRNGVILNGYVQGQKNLYETVHSIHRRKVGLVPVDRAKFPTYDDPGPPLDANGIPILPKEGSMTPIPEIDLNEELEKVELLLSEPQGVIPANLRRRGIVLARMEKYARAMEDIDRAVHLEPTNLEGLWHRHQQYLRINDAESALVDLDSLTEHNKGHFAAFQAKARIYQAIGLYKLAISNYSMVIRFKSENVDAYHNRACLYEMEDETILANEDFRSVRLLDPTNDQAIHNLAMYSFQRQLWSDCISEFTKLINIDPENAQALMYRGRSYAALSFYSEAMQDLTQAIRLSPDTAVYYFHRGCLLREQHIGKRFDFDPENKRLLTTAAQLYQKQKLNELAILDYLTVIDLNPRKSRALLNLGILYMKHTKNFAEALAYLNKGIATDQTNLRGYISRGELYEILYRQALLQQANVNTKRKFRITTKLDTATNYAMMAIKDYSRAIHLRPSNYLLFLYRGRMLLKQGKVEEATVDFHAAFDLNSSIAQTFMQRALILSFQRKYKQIIEEYDERKANQQQVRDPALLLLVAKARIRYGDFEGALADLNSVSDQARVDHQISLQKGICYEHLKNWSMASGEFSNCIIQTPNFSKAYYHRGLCKLAEGDGSGEQDLNKAIELDPKFFDAYVTRAAYYESVSNFAKGILDCDEALRLEPTSIRAHILRGSCKCKLSQYALAISDFTKAIFIDKTSPFPFYNRAIAYQYAGEHYNAIKDYSIVLLLQDNMNAYKNRAMLYWKLGDNENALLDFLAAKNLNPSDSKLRSLLGLGLQKVGKYEESCREFTVAMSLDANMKEAILGRGNVYAAMGDLTKSRKDYSRVLHMYPKSADTLINIAYTMQQERRPKDAWRYFTMAYTIDPRCTAALKGRALVNSSTNNPFSAYLDITRAIEISPENAELLNNRGVIYESLDDNVSALQNYKLAINADKTFGLAYYNAANHYLKQHSWEKAAEYYTKAIEFDFKDHAALLNRGIALLMIKQFDAAKSDFDTVLQLSPDSSLAFFNMGYLYSQLGQHHKAEETYTKVIELSPTDKVAYLCRAEARSKQGKWKAALEDHAFLL